MYNRKYIKDHLQNIDLARELNGIKYMLTVVLSNQFRLQNSIDFNISLLVEEKEKRKENKKEKQEKVIPKEIKEINKEKKKEVRREQYIQFEKFSIKARQYEALVQTYGHDVMTDAIILLDGYIKRSGKHPRDIYNKLKNWAIHQAMKQRINEIQEDIISIATEVDHTKITDLKTALKFIANVPSHLRNVDPSVKYLVDKFGIGKEADDE